MLRPDVQPRVEVEVVAYGRPATVALARRITAAKVGGHPLDPVTVVVPSNSAGLSARRLLATGDASGGLAPINVANVGFVTAFRLAELVGSAQLGGRLPLTNPVLAAAARSALAASTGMFAAAAGHRATQSAVVSLYGELSRALPATRDRVAAASRRGAEVVSLVAAIRARLTGFYDEDDLARAATARLAADPAAGGPLGTVVWYLPDRLTPAMTAFVGGALTQARPMAAVIVAVCGAGPADAAVLDSVRRAGVDLDVPAMATVAAIAGVETPCANRIISASDADEEVRQVVRDVVQLVADGTALDRIAIFRPSSGSYGRTLVEQLDGAGIPHNGPAARRLADTVAGRTLLGALALDRRGWGRSEVIALVTGAPVRAGDRLAPSRRWDAISRRAGVVGGLADWQSKLGQLIDTSSTTSLDLEAATRLAAFVDALAGSLAAIDDAGTWAGRAAAARAMVALLLGPEPRRVHWPDFEVTAAQRVDEALARLATLDAIEPEAGRATFELAVATELDATVGRVGRFGQGVLIAPLASAVGLDLDAVFVLGMAEGTCPAFGLDDALLPDDDRRLAVAAELLTRDDRLRTQHRSYLAALAAGARHRTVVFARGDLRSRRDQRPSRWLLDSVSELSGSRSFSSHLAGLPHLVHTVASYADGVAKAATHGSVVERDIAALLVAADPPTHPLVTGDLGRGFAARLARAGPDFTEWDGNLAGQPVASPATGVPMSPSRLETWASCPFRYFLAKVLELGERDDPERLAEIRPNEKGKLIHGVLEAFVTEVLARPYGPPPPDERWTAADRVRVAELAEAAFAEVHARGLTGRPLTWRRTRADVLADLEVFLTKDDEHRQDGRLRPAQAEMAFGQDDEAPLSLTLPSGRSLTFRGKADRVDIAEDGHLVVLDYKTGSDWAYGELDSDPVRAGVTLQLGVYAEAARARFGAAEVEAHYWFISGRGRYRQLGYRWTEPTQSRFLDVTEAIIDGIEAGAFPARPGEYDSFRGTNQNCTFCDFDRVCPRDREDHQRATAAAPELTVLGRLQLPEVDQ